MAYPTQVDSVYSFLMLWLFVRRGFPSNLRSDLPMLQPSLGRFRRMLRLLVLIPRRWWHRLTELVLSDNFLFEKINGMIASSIICLYSLLTFSRMALPWDEIETLFTSGSLVPSAPNIANAA